MKKFGEFLIERTINGDMYKVIGDAFVSLDRMDVFLSNLGDVGQALQILDEILSNMRKIKEDYGSNSDTLGSDNRTAQLGEVFHKFEDYFLDLRGKIQSGMKVPEIIGLLAQAKKDLKNDHESAFYFVHDNTKIKSPWNGPSYPPFEHKPF